VAAMVVVEYFTGAWFISDFLKFISSFKTWVCCTEYGCDSAVSLSYHM